MYDSRLALINPGPVEFDGKVLQAMATPATSHVDPLFINSFGNAIQMLRKVFMAPTGQPFVLAGSGTLGWDMTASNLVEPGENVLVVNTGIFGNWFAECLQVYGAKVDQVVAPFGDCPTLEAIEAQLSQKKYKMITITQVDTSSGVLANVKEIAELTRRVSAETLICVDGVCSIGAEELRMEDWGIDVALTGSQVFY
jgi:alanine-glyoxylate transaminase/serine-glyoxylate transaminase/serine-pyruvate transaminase